MKNINKPYAYYKHEKVNNLKEILDLELEKNPLDNALS